MAGRNPKPVEEVKHRVVVLIEKKVIDELGTKNCEEISKEHLYKEYAKRLKTKTK